MKVQSLTIGNFQVKNNVFLAPMAGYTDYAFRHGQIGLGIGLTFTELVSAKGLMFGGNGSSDLLYSGNDIDYTSAQIFGSDAYYLRSACESEYLAPFNVIDINMGCPVPKVVKNGEGSALLTDIKKAENIVKECVKSGKNITIKIRTGQVKGDDVATDFAKMAEQSGAKLITIHGRVRESYYSGEVDYNAIEKAKKSVSIPVIANGGIFTKQDADLIMDRTGADGIMLARGAIANPFLISEILRDEQTLTHKDFVINHFRDMIKLYGDKKAAVEFRKFVPYYFKGRVGVKDIKLALQTTYDTNIMMQILKENL